MKLHRLLSIFLLTSIIATSVSCGGEYGSTDSTSDDTSAGDTTTAAPEYIFPELDCGGDDFVISSCKPTTWNMHGQLDVEEQNGEMLDDAIYDRNAAVEEMYKLNFVIQYQPIYETDDYIRTLVMADEDVLDAAYCIGEQVAPLIGDGYVYDLNTIPELQLDQPWWNQNVRDSATIGKNNSLFYAINDFSLTAFDLTWCVFFNESMIEDLKLDSPYDLVRDGKWTLDKMAEYAKKGASLNGDESFTYSADGNAVYGLTTYNNFVGACMTGADIPFTKRGSDGTPALALENDRFYTFAEKYATLFGNLGETITANDDQKHYEKIFKAGRALMVGAELKASTTYRDMEDSFGVLPTPKFDESQDEYKTFVNYLCMLMTIPSTVADTKRSGVVMDTLAYLSMKDVLPIYYDVTISQKGLRNEDSIEMLGIIRDSRSFESSLAYGWTKTLYENGFRDKLQSGDSSVASIIAGQKSSVASLIKETVDIVNQ